MSYRSWCIHRRRNIIIWIHNIIVWIRQKIRRIWIGPIISLIKIIIRQIVHIRWRQIMLKSIWIRITNIRILFISNIVIFLNKSMLIPHMMTHIIRIHIWIIIWMIEILKIRIKLIIIRKMLIFLRKILGSINILWGFKKIINYSITINNIKFIIINI